jgi:hypothetical protein
MATLRDGLVIMLAGRNSDGVRLSDVWKLSFPSQGWDTNLDIYNETAIRRLGRSPVWEYLQCSKIAGEDVPTKRSNSASVVCGDYLFLVFGGWGVDSQCLDECELLHLESLCWTHCSKRGSTQPSPRGNPTMVYSDQTNSATLFGGWNKVDKLSEVWVLDLSVWKWKLQAPRNGDPWPQGRTGHSTALWSHNSTGKDLMLVYGGSLEDQGCSSELWSLDLALYQWQERRTTRHRPPAQTSHSAAIVVVGGTGNGIGRSMMLTDAWMLNLDCMTWTKLSWNETGVACCRHNMAVVNGGTVLIWGGYNGTSTIQDGALIWVGDAMKVDSTVTTVLTTEHNQLQERWEAEVPLRESDLSADVLGTKAKASKLPGALLVAQNRDKYIDPATGYSVFTQIYLKRRSCCRNSCRHCPHGHVNVTQQCEKSQPDPDLEW